eukprot:gnl/TRDRNA2_/TRDRNA2_183171_c0_seq1.p2 gnl/TRDRNA2_/TRDRNA2_183171_c0~~gnl/TRDRNA2_/TRDRNA2_183171_c0_seq1.p2  ORF type:complete len:143 (-),score=38.18 gnl/TRDRNA2_/TRDRNA2_183171_c0_seq1:85-513(-)
MEGFNDREVAANYLRDQKAKAIGEDEIYFMGQDAYCPRLVAASIPDPRKHFRDATPKEVATRPVRFRPTFDKKGVYTGSEAAPGGYMPPQDELSGVYAPKPVADKPTGPIVPEKPKVAQRPDKDALLQQIERERELWKSGKH